MVLYLVFLNKKVHLNFKGSFTIEFIMRRIKGTENTFTKKLHNFKCQNISLLIFINIKTMNQKNILKKRI